MRTPAEGGDGDGERRRVPSATPLGDVGQREDRVYRPLLFQSTGYASSELFRDSYEMRSRIPAAAGTSTSAPLLAQDAGNGDNGGWNDGTQSKRHVFEPQIRLETLSSSAATAVLWITYLFFLLAFALPYLQSKGYLETVRRRKFCLLLRDFMCECD
ncbi:hypothetical protein BBJ28_00024447 [Nothophytophthora sp. Chile5]|nr:hypothetical protein BBJ28_00024447 [Nothophytophthora sp. Chile5]